MTNNIMKCCEATFSSIQHLILTISDITGYSDSVTYAHFYNLIKDIEVKLSVIPPQLLNNIETQIYSIYTIKNKDIKIDSLRGWLLYFFHSSDIVENIMKDIVSAHINVYFEDENSNKTCRILSNRIIKEIERVYRKLDEFEKNALKLNLATTSYENLITRLKRLKRIGGVNPDLIPLQYFLLDIPVF